MDLTENHGEQQISMDFDCFTFNTQIINCASFPVNFWMKFNNTNQQQEVKLAQVIFSLFF